MARDKRIDFPGCWHHVMHRGARREPIFRRDEHCELFLECLSEAVVRSGLEVHAYALMPNHYHLLVRSPLGTLSDGMRHLNGDYTQQLNHRCGWDGPIFRGRFHSQIVPDEVGLRHVFAYLHLNPHRAGLAQRLEDCCWTSLRVYLGIGRCPDWLTTGVFHASLGGAAGVRRLVTRLRKRPEEWPEGMDLETGWFTQMEEKAPSARIEVGGRGALRVPLERVLQRVCKTAGCSLDELRRSQKGPHANPARRFAVWAMSRAGGYSQREIGEALAMSEGQVGKVLGRIRRERPPAPLDGWMQDYAESA